MYTSCQKIPERKKEPKDMLIECLKDVRADISQACNRIEDKNLYKAMGRIDNFLTILSYLNNAEEVE